MGSLILLFVILEGFIIDLEIFRLVSYLIKEFILGYSYI